MHTETVRSHTREYIRRESRHPDAESRGEARRAFTCLRDELYTEEIQAVTGLTRDEIIAISSMAVSLDMTSERLRDIVARVSRAAGCAV